MVLHIPDTLSAERDKYEAIWEQEDYKKISPGDRFVPHFLRIVQPQAGESIIDLGCGEGRAGLMFEEHGLLVTWLDIVTDQLDPKVPRERFISSTLWQSWDLNNRRGWDYGYCCDVIEHLHTEYVMLALERMTRACRVLWLQVGCREDTHGRAIGADLHLTVRDHIWWLERIASIATVTDARDLCARSIFIVERNARNQV
jgi:hypothetical protein